MINRLFSYVSPYIVWFLLSAVTLGCKKSNHNVQFGQNNAVWAESIYLRGYRPSTGIKLTDEMIYDYARLLRKNRIKYVYLFAGPYGVDGHLPKYPFSKPAQEVVGKLKKSYPDLAILPWVGGIQNKTVYLADSSWVANALFDTKRLVSTLNCDGIHVDLEFILKEDGYLYSGLKPERPGDLAAYGHNVNSFHRKLRRLLPGKFISSVVTATSQSTRPWKRKTSFEELKELVPLVDQINFLYYDTAISGQKEFEEGCDELVADIHELKGENPHVQFLIAIGTFVNDPMLQQYRDLEIENIPNTLSTIKASIAKTTLSKQVVDGISIFCDWKTSEDEWEEFRINWVENL